jgi:acetyltransferase-like isoleucine patch superfamily enzyme
MLRWLVRTLKHYRWRLASGVRERRWRNGLRARGCKVHPSLTFTGRDLRENVAIGDGVIVGPNVTVWMSEDEAVTPALTVGERTGITGDTIISVHHPVTIGRAVLIGPHTYITSANHRADRRDIPIVDQGYVGEPLVIEDDVWIGTHAVLLPGTQLRRGCIIAAGAVVNCDVPAYEVWGGVPARFLKQRDG